MHLMEPGENSVRRNCVRQGPPIQLSIKPGLFGVSTKVNKSNAFAYISILKLAYATLN